VLRKELNRKRKPALRVPALTRYPKGKVPLA